MRPSKLGIKAWWWIKENCPRHGSLITPEKAGMTVAAIEAACGEGALTAAKLYCQRHKKGEFGAAFPYAARQLPVLEAQLLSGWDRDRAEQYAREWRQKYGTDQCTYIAPDGEELPTDAVMIHYPVVG